MPAVLFLFAACRRGRRWLSQDGLIGGWSSTVLVTNTGGGNESRA